LSATRRETLSWLALLIMQHGTISLWRLAAFRVHTLHLRRIQAQPHPPLLLTVSGGALTG
jgi:hypothetical protein